jgi:hypothetical protein
MESLKIFGMILMLGMVYSFMSDDDYHKRFDKPMIIRYDCRMLIGGWHPDVPTEVIDACRKQNNERNINVKSY